MMKSWKDVEIARERRLWLTQVFVPAGILVGAVLADDECRNGLKRKAKETKEKIKSKFKK